MLTMLHSTSSVIFCPLHPLSLCDCGRASLFPAPPHTHTLGLLPGSPHRRDWGPGPGLARWSWMASRAARVRPVALDPGALRHGATPPHSLWDLPPSLSGPLPGRGAGTQAGGTGPCQCERAPVCSWLVWGKGAGQAAGGTG